MAVMINYEVTAFVSKEGKVGKIVAGRAKSEYWKDVELIYPEGWMELDNPTAEDTEGVVYVIKVYRAFYIRGPKPISDEDVIRLVKATKKRIFDWPELQSWMDMDKDNG